MSKTTKIKLTREQKRWLRENYPITKNDEILKFLGMSHSTLHRIARKMKLKKDPAYIKQCNQEATARMVAHNRATGFAASAKGFRMRYQKWKDDGKITPWGGGFKKGETAKDRLGAEKDAERIRKAQATRAKNVARDRRRIALGLDPLTRLVRAVSMPRSECAFRYAMKKRGYLVFRHDPVIYYDNNTIRNSHSEATAVKSHGLQVAHVSQRVTN